MVLKIFLILISFLILEGCSNRNITTNSHINQKEKILLKESSIFVYRGIGYGKNRIEAKNDALNSIASQISSTISSRINIEKKIFNKTYNRTVDYYLKSEIAKISFSGFQIIQDEWNNNDYIFVLEVNKKNLKLKYIRKIERFLSELEELIKHSSSSFEKYSIVKKSNLNNLYMDVEIIKSIDGKYNISPYLNKLKRYSSILSKPIFFKVTGNSPEAISIAKTFLTEKGFLISSNGQVDLHIVLSPIKSYKSHHQYIGTSFVTIKIQDISKLFFNKSFKLSGVSSIDKESTKEYILNSLKSKITNQLKEIL